MDGGLGGWCVHFDDSIGCGGLGAEAGPILQDWSGSGHSPTHPGGQPEWEIHGIAIAISEVVAVSLGTGSPIPTRAEAALPDQLRVVAVEWNGIGEEAPDFPHFTPLDASGQPITKPRSELHNLLVAPDRTKHWERPKPEARGACKLIPIGLKQLSAQWGTVVTHIAGYADSIGRPFLSCISTEYYLEGWPLLAGVLLDGAHPGTAPAALPAMQPLRAHPGVFAAPGAEGEMFARRIPGAWLVVSGGSSRRRAVELLEHIRAVVRL
jgi:hypothetical protein